MDKGGEAGYQEIILGASPAPSAFEFLFTLSECYVKPPVWSPRYKGLLRLSFSVEMVIRGKHFPTRQKLKFKTLLVDFTHLFEWVDVSGIKSGIDLEPEKLDLDSLITYKRPQPIKASVSNYSISLYFEREPRLEPLLGAKEESCVKQRVYAMIEFPKKQSLGKFEEVCYHFRNFLSLGVAHPVYPQEIKARLEGKHGAEDIEFFIVRPHYSVGQSRLSINDMLFTYANISSRFERHLCNWVGNSHRLKPVYDLYFGIIHNPSSYLIQSFLSWVQALETYHRRLAKKYEFTNDAKSRLVQAVLDQSCSNYDIKSLQNRKKGLQDRKEPPLLMRILELLEMHEEVLRPIFAYWETVYWQKNVDPQNVDWLNVEFAEFVTHTRNYYTHLEPAKDSAAPTSDELWEANETIKFLLQACLRFELGFSTEQTKQFFSRNEDFRRLERHLHLLSQHLIRVPLHRL